ncbi:cytochrome b/b6 domain-containing protein [Immundisolibacter sp.]|uniref:cytochrome b/b6 domain-containing protein n=1 Tax=Immundisolibacter sp. TaxID=1934948 RepID=UPI002613D0E0|nr:cytochrome b/b6 domain-containing protein [Immundisolibacter sp.]MDD3652089.1 cytochrome b/b6 domain-containing protein [Immundisolibacter sp.]
MDAPRETKVWDLGIRIGHWLLVLAFAVAYVTEGEPRWLHVYAGYAIGAWVVLRLLWGFVGPRHARFADFVRGPRQVLAHVRGIARLKPPRYLGHDPTGGWMVLALLLGLTGTVISGLALYAVEDHAGPLAAWVGTAAPSETAGGDHRQSGALRQPEGEGEEALEEIHEVFANLTLALVFIHIGGVLLVSFTTRENLILAMFTGRKRGEGAD